MENEEKGITLGRLFKVAFGNWKVFVPVALVVAVASFLGIQFGLNTLRGSYSSTFSYSSADLSQSKYADGSDFYYRNLISSLNLEEVKASNEKYASINVQKILDNNGISISNDAEEKTYTIKLGYRFLKNNEIAKSFISDIAASALKKDAEIVANSSFDSSLRLFDDAETFEQQVSYLNKEAEFLLSSYDTLIKNPSSSLSVINAANGNCEKISTLMGADFVNKMNYRISSNGYVKDYSVQDTDYFNYQIAVLGEQYKQNKDRIDALNDEIKTLSTDVSVQINTINEKVVQLTIENTDIKNQQTALALKRDNKTNTDPDFKKGYDDFVNELKSYRTKLSNAVDDYKGVIKNAYVDDAAVNPEDSSIIKLNGTVAIYLNIPVSLVLGVIVAAVVDLIVDRKKLYE